MTPPASTAHAVERILSRRVGSAVRVVDVEELATARGNVERMRCAEPIPGIGSSVIVKRRDLDGFSTTNLGTEAVALELLGDIESDVAPRLLGGGPLEGLIVMTDLGQETVESVLFGDDPAAARVALVATGEAVARLHRAPCDSRRFAEIDTWTLASRESGWDVLRSSLRDLGFPGVPPAGEDEQRRVLETLGSPGSSTVMTHGDLTPNNVVVGADARCRLIDFEGAGPQHVGIDLCMLRFPFAWYGRWAAVPGEVQFSMERAYRSSVDLDSDDLDRSLAVGCMAMALVRLERMPRIADPRQTANDAFRRRLQIASTLDVTVAACSLVDEFPVLVNWLQQLLEAMRERWPEARERPPLFPAFR